MSSIKPYQSHHADWKNEIFMIPIYNTVQKMSTHVCKCKNDTYWNYSRNWGRGEWRRMVEGVNSSMIYLIHCKNLCKCHNVPPPAQKRKKTFLLKIIHYSYQYKISIHFFSSLGKIFGNKHAEWLYFVTSPPHKKGLVEWLMVWKEYEVSAGPNPLVGETSTKHPM
jgi:hypothetical protein